MMQLAVVFPCVQVCLRGPTLFSGYFKQPELTPESTDKDGFFHTGKAHRALIVLNLGCSLDTGPTQL